MKSRILLRSFVLSIYCAFPPAVFAHEDGPLMDKSYQVVSYKTSDGAASKTPPRFYGIHFRGGLLRGWVEMNSFLHFHSGYQIWNSSDSIFFDRPLVSDVYVKGARSPVEETFEKEIVTVFPKMHHFAQRGDSLFLDGDGEIILVRYGQLSQRLQKTWISDADSTQGIIVDGNTWTYYREGEVIGSDSNDVYTFHAEDDKWMNGNGNLVCDYVRLEGPGGTKEFWVIGASSQLLLSDVHSEVNYSYKSEEYYNSLHEFAEARQDIEGVCKEMLYVLSDPKRTGKITMFIPPKKVYINYRLAHNDSQRSRKEIRKEYKRVYVDSNKRQATAVHHQGVAEKFDWSTAYVWHVNCRFPARTGDNEPQYAWVVLSVSDKVEGNFLYEIVFKMICLDNVWYLDSGLKRFPLSSYF